MSFREAGGALAVARAEAPARETAGVVEVLSTARDFLEMRVAWLGRIHGRRYEVTEIDGHRDVLGLHRGSVTPLEGTICRETLGRDEPLVIRDLDAAHGRDLPEHALRSYVGVPVVLGDGTVYGTLCLGDDRPARQLDDRHQRLVALLARTAGETIDRARLHDANRRLVASLDARSAATEALAAALDTHDHYTAEHSRATVRLAAGVAEAMGLGAAQRETVEQVALLHDIGKVGIPEAVLRKSGPLDVEEWALVREHPVLGERIVRQVPALADLGPAIRAEHERYDGDGYPDGLVGAAIPVASRIVLACDAWHAMCSDRSYRPAMPPDRARAELLRHAGTQFDPQVVTALLAVVDDGRHLDHAGGDDVDVLGGWRSG